MADSDDQGPPPEFSPLKLSAKSLKVTRPTLFSLIVTPEEFYDYAGKVFDAYKNGGLKVCPLPFCIVVSGRKDWPNSRSRFIKSTTSPRKMLRKLKKTLHRGRRPGN